MTVFYKGSQNSTRRNRKILFNLHQVFCCCVKDDILNTTVALQFFCIGRSSTVLNRSHQKYIRIHVVRFIGEALEQINLEIFGAILKPVMLFSTIIAFSCFKNNTTLLDSTYVFQTDKIENMVNLTKYILTTLPVEDIMCF